MKSIEIVPVVKDYAWGNKDFIPSLVGGYTGGSQAELWMGTHPSGEAMVKDGPSLRSWLDDNKDALGKSELPLLFKVLAINSPLSLQCHPNLEQAKDGWSREAAARERGESVNYQDDNEKEEVIAALSPITAMCGFRTISVIKDNLKRVVPSFHERYFEKSESPKDIFFCLYSLEDREKTGVLEEFSSSLESLSDSSWNGNFLTEKGISKKCLKEYPGDIGALFPYILNVVHLRIGEALYLKPGTLHAYVYGNGIELMSASDNVLRGGLTKKRIDLEELERIMTFEPTEIRKSKSMLDRFGRRVYETPSTVFRLLEAQSGEYHINTGSCMLMLVTEGQAQIREPDGILDLKKGSAALIPMSLSNYTLLVHGEVFMAEVV